MNQYGWQPISTAPKHSPMVWVRGDTVAPTAVLARRVSETFFLPIRGGRPRFGLLRPTEWAPFVDDEYPWGSFPE